MADISKIKVPNGTTYNIKDANAIPKNIAGNTQNLRRPSYLNGGNDLTLDTKINTLRANRLAFLPANQIIVEKTTDGGTTWVDAGVSDVVKTSIFSETRQYSLLLPLLNGVRSKQCGLRITFTAMRYNVPDGTPETEKYNYWNPDYVVLTERYCQIKEFYFWVSVSTDTMGVKFEYANASAPTTWQVGFNDSTFCMTGWSGCDYISSSQRVFGGGTTQTSQPWNYRLTFMTKGTAASHGETMADTYTTSAQAIMEIRAYGDTWWTKPNEYMANDKIYTHDYLQNVTFPANLIASKFVGPVETSSLKIGNLTPNDNYSWGNQTGTGMARWDSTGGGSMILRTNNPSTGMLSLLLDGTVYVNEGRYPVLSTNDLSTSTSSTSTTTAATSSAVKTAYDLANTANGTANTALSGVEGTLIYDHTYTIANGVATFTAHVYCKGEEVTSDYADSCFTWGYRLDSAISSGSPSVVSLGTGKTKTINISTLGYGGHVIGQFTPPE